jgi:hypothetical protein
LPGRAKANVPAARSTTLPLRSKHLLLEARGGGPGGGVESEEIVEAGGECGAGAERDERE